MFTRRIRKPHQGKDLTFEIPSQCPGDVSVGIESGQLDVARTFQYFYYSVSIQKDRAKSGSAFGRLARFPGQKLDRRAQLAIREL